MGSSVDRAAADRYQLKAQAAIAGLSSVLRSGSPRGRAKPGLPGALTWRGLPTTLLAILTLVVIGFIQPGFLGATQFTPFLATNAPTILLGVGVSFALLVGGIDLSVGPVMGLCAIVTVLLSSVGFKLFSLGPSGAAAVCANPQICQQGIAFPEVAVLVLAVGAFFGLVNGVTIAVFRLQPLVATLATGFITGGLSLYLLPQPGGQMPASLIARYTEPAIISWPMVIIIAFTVIAYLAMRTPAGVKMRAVGSNRWKAFTSGVPVRRATLLAYVASGLAAGAAGVLLTLNSGSADPSVGITYTLTAIAGAVMGGTALRGGWAEPFGPAIGVITLGLLSELVTVLNVPAADSELATGVIILLGLTATQLLLRLWSEQA
jgi:ribose transport system permease protein